MKGNQKNKKKTWDIKENNRPDLAHSCTFSSLTTKPFEDAFIMSKFPYDTMTTRLAQGNEWFGDQPLPIFCINNRNKRLPIYKLDI